MLKVMVSPLPPAGVSVEKTSSGFLLIDVPAGTIVSEPLLLTESGPGFELILGRGAKIVLVSELTGHLEKHRASIKLGDEAEAEIVSLQALEHTGTCILEQESELRSNAICRWRNATIGGAAITHTLMSRLTGDHATSSIDWLFYGRGQEHYSLTARNVFLGKNGGGEIIMKGVAEERAQIKADGMIEIGLQGGGTETFLTQQVLMLDPSAKIDAIPGLEIHTNDVKASHSATVARLTPEDLFTFASRGIPEKEARRMFTEGFIGDLAAKMPAAAAGRCLQMIESKYAR